MGVTSNKLITMPMPSVMVKKLRLKWIFRSRDSSPHSENPRMDSGWLDYVFTSQEQVFWPGTTCVHLRMPQMPQSPQKAPGRRDSAKDRSGTDRERDEREERRAVGVGRGEKA